MRNILLGLYDVAELPADGVPHHLVEAGASLAGEEEEAEGGEADTEEEEAERPVSQYPHLTWSSTG